MLYFNELSDKINYLLIAYVVPILAYKEQFGDYMAHKI